MLKTYWKPRSPITPAIPTRRASLGQHSTQQRHWIHFFRLKWGYGVSWIAPPGQILAQLAQRLHLLRRSVGIFFEKRYASGPKSPLAQAIVLPGKRKGFETCTSASGVPTIVMSSNLPIPKLRSAHMRRWGTSRIASCPTTATETASTATGS